MLLFCMNGLVCHLLIYSCFCIVTNWHMFLIELSHQHPTLWVQYIIVTLLCPLFASQSLLHHSFHAFTAVHSIMTMAHVPSLSMIMPSLCHMETSQWPIVLLQHFIISSQWAVTITVFQWVITVAYCAFQPTYCATFCSTVPSLWYLLLTLCSVMTPPCHILSYHNALSYTHSALFWHSCPLLCTTVF